MATTAPLVEVTIEISRGSFLKRGSEGHLDFVSPLPCPFNYGSVRDYIGGEGDFLDAVVLGPRLRRGQVVSIAAYGSVGLSERGMYDDKLICAREPITPAQKRRVVQFFHIYAFCKGMYNRFRGYPGDASCHGWGLADEALARAEPIHGTQPHPSIKF